MKKAVALLLALVMVLALCGCGLSSGDLVGVWNGSWEYNGNMINEIIAFESNGHYEKAVYINGNPYSTESSTYEIKGNKLILHKNDDTGYTEYKYHNGKLTNNKHDLTKSS